MRSTTLTGQAKVLYFALLIAFGAGVVTALVADSTLQEVGLAISGVALVLAISTAATKGHLTQLGRKRHGDA